MFDKDKVLSIEGFSHLFNTDLEILKKNKLAVLTPFGLIIGNLIDKSIKEPTDLQSIFLKIDESVKKYNNEKKPKSQASAFLILEDVKIITSNNSINLPIISIFYDQIIGFSLSE